jgi:hypothetical protein
MPRSHGEVSQSHAPHQGDVVHHALGLVCEGQRQLISRQRGDRAGFTHQRLFRQSARDDLDRFRITRLWQRTPARNGKTQQHIIESDPGISENES